MDDEDGNGGKTGCRPYKRSPELPTRMAVQKGVLFRRQALRAVGVDNGCKLL